MAEDATKSEARVATGDLKARVERLESGIADIQTQNVAVLDALKGLGEAFQQMRETQGKLPRAKDPDKELSEFTGLRDSELAQHSRTVDLQNPRAGLTGLQPQDIVLLKKESDLYQRLEAGFNKRNEPLPEAIYGVVRKFMYIKRNGQRKYLVHFQGIGADGCLEGEIELVKPAA